MPKGPRILFKDDRDSSIGRGCVLYAAQLRPEVIAIVTACARTAPTLRSDTMIVSEGYRSIREKRDLHKESRAFDISCNQIPDEAKREEIARDWAIRIRSDLGPDYEVIPHGAGANFHLHIELDP